MGINRFSTTGTSEYTPQHVPLPFDTISKLGEQIKLEHDTADAAAAVAKTDIQPGLMTEDHAKILNAKKNELLRQAQARAEQTQNYGRLTQDIKEIAATIQNDPLYQGIQRDIAQTERANKQRYDPNFGYTVQGYADKQGKVRQLGPNERFDESLYNIVAPGDRNAERKPLYAQIKPVISRIYEQPVTKTWIDEMGREHTQTLQEGVEAEGLRRKQVKSVLANYIKQDPNALNTQSYMYDKARFAKQGLDWTPEQELDATANAFLGEYYNEKEIQKLGADKVTSPLKDASSRTRSGSGSGDEDGIVNQYALLVHDKTAQVAAPQLDHLGWTKGPDDVPGSHMVTLDNTDGQGAIVNFARVTPDNPQANNIVTYGNEVNNIKKNTGIEDNEIFLEKLKAKDPKSTYQIVGNQIYVTSPTIVNGKNTIKTVNVPIEAMKDAYLKTTDDFKLLADEAKENGVDISDPKFKDNYLKTLGVKTIKEAEDMGQMFSKITGQYPFILKDGNNKVNVGDKAFLDGYIILTRDQVDREMANLGYSSESSADYTSGNIMPTNIHPGMDDWEEVFLEGRGGNNMIQPFTATRDGVEQFKIPIKKPIQISQIVNQNYNNSFYTPTIAGKKSEYFAESYNDILGKGLMERRNKVFGQSYTNNPTTFKNNIVADISSDRNINADVKGELFNIINELKNNPKATKETWVGFKNALSLDGAEEILKRYKNNGVVAQPPATVGKSQGGWSQTPATPLAK